MHRMFRKDQILTIPNLLSMIRILLIPVMVLLYISGKYYELIGVIAASALTDIVDGKIARRFNMVSDFGKILDPIADKVTQGVLMICLISRYPSMLILVIFLAVKELITSLLGFFVIRKKDFVNTARWYGKLATVVLYSSMMILILFPLGHPAEQTVANIAVAVCIAVITLSMILYSRSYIIMLTDKRTDVSPEKNSSNPKESK